MKIGVLALQGAFIEHINILRRLGVEAVEVRLPEDLAGLDGLNGGEPFPAVFIRGPRLVAAHGDARVIARLADGTPVAAEEGRWLATSFHPELTGDTRLHEYFLRLVEKN